MLFSDVWSENAALLKDWWKFIQIHQYYLWQLTMGDFKNDGLV